MERPPGHTVTLNEQKGKEQINIYPMLPSKYTEKGQEGYSPNQQQFSLGRDVGMGRGTVFSNQTLIFI